ncbi:MAG: hypothetical protein GXO99_02230 [Nitrospirae bacterium]|nr:hypothetical protein [Nitrospirota bacterium]
MRKWGVFLIMVMVVFTASTVLAGNISDPLIKKRMHTQQLRIKQGIKDGSLTLREAIRLEREQARIRCEERRFKADGVLTKRERIKLHRDLDRASRHIFREKHDRQRRN